MRVPHLIKMSGQKLPSINSITKDEFKATLSRYPDLIARVSDSRSSKSGHKTLKQLDQYRYTEAPRTFSPTQKPEKQMGLEDVIALVEWKLRHGKFRPTLMSLVSQNSDTHAQQIIRQALELYSSSKDSLVAVNELSKLKGIGPATASLLLAVHYPEDVIFFSDEAFWWICCGGARDAIKYNAKEYKSLAEASEHVVKRLAVPALQVEQVAFVIMREGIVSEPKVKGQKLGGESTSAPAVKRKREEPAPLKNSSAVENGSLRRSRRLKPQEANKE